VCGTYSDGSEKRGGPREAKWYLKTEALKLTNRIWYMILFIDGVYRNIHLLAVTNRNMRYELL